MSEIQALYLIVIIMGAMNATVTFMMTSALNDEIQKLKEKQ